MPLTPQQEAFLTRWLKKRKAPTIERRNPTPPCSQQKDPNPKWSDDAWFEERYGDPDYYNRIKGLD
jgi:hypothetical protein